MKRISLQNILWAAIPALLLSGCTKEGFEQDGNTPVSFSTQIATRASGTTWTATDPVGVFMKTAGPTLGAATPLADNKLFTATATGAITASTGNTVYFPMGSTTVDFVAYYPYRATPVVTPYIYKVSVANQNNASRQAGVDLMYSDNATGIARTKDAVPMTFAHKLSLLEISVTRGTTLSSVNFSAVTASIQGMPATADFSLVDGTTFSNPGAAANIAPLRGTATAEGAAFKAILVPQPTGGTGRKVVFTLGTNRYTWTIPDGAIFASGQRNAYAITVNKTGITVTAADITPWDDATTPITGTGGTAERFNIGDYYPDPNVTFSAPGVVSSGVAPIGIVFWLDATAPGYTPGTPAKGTKGKIVSLDEGASLEWGPYPSTTTATNMIYGKANQTVIEGIAGFQTKYLAFNWVYVKNGSTLGGPWYLPAWDELRALYAGFSGLNYGASGTGGIASWGNYDGMPDYHNYTAARTTFNSKLTAPGSTAISGTVYCSSSQHSYFFAWYVSFDFGYAHYEDKSYPGSVRAVQVF